MPPAPRSPQPYGTNLVRFLIAALLITSGVQAWQVLEPPSTTYASVDGAPRVFVVNVTVPESNEGVPSSPTGNNATRVETPGTPEAVPEPVPVRIVQAPKYTLATDFEWEVLVSETPLVYTPWAGNGPPTVLIYYKGIHDILMLHNAWVALHDLTGFDACSSPIVRYWNWTAVDTSLSGTRLTYQSHPVPENPYNLMGTGENCYARLGVQSVWNVMACMEGDGELSKTHEEAAADGPILEYVDAMDYCATKTVRITAGP